MTTRQLQQRSIEKDVLDHIEICNKQNEGYKPRLIKKSWFRAIDRLVEKKEIAWKKSRNYGLSGYWKNA